MVQIKDLTYRHTRKISMAFRMNKPVIKGTKAHSALLKTTATTDTRTHSGDPTISLAATEYGKSFKPGDIDYSIKSRKLDWEQYKLEEEEENNNKEKENNKKIKNKVKKEKNNIVVNEKEEIINIIKDKDNSKEEVREKIVEVNKLSAYDRLRNTIAKKKAKRELKRQEEKDLAKLEGFQANYETEEIKNEQLDIDAFVDEEEQDTIDPAHINWFFVNPDSPYNPKNINKPKYDSEGNPIGHSNIVMNPGYHYDPKTGVWTYNGLEIDPRQVTEEEKKKQLKKVNVEEKKKQLKKVNVEEKKKQLKKVNVEEKKVEEETSQKRNMGKQSDVVGTIDGAKVTNSDIGELRRIARSSQNFHKKMEAKKKLDRLQKN